MSERVHVVADPGRDPQVLGQEALPVEELPAHRLACRQVAVRLDPLAARDDPAPVPHKRTRMRANSSGDVSMTQR